ncbi:MAG: restriction endonuclease [Nitrospinae bacterium]|nr:restriction endonuclease [Nitrospinota bacterium]
MRKLIIQTLCSEASTFSAEESQHPEPSLFGVTDGKAVGTYLEHKFRTYLTERGYSFEEGSSASGIDFPDLCVDMKVTSIRQPQSSCPFKSARQKIYGLGYSLIIFVYDKNDDEALRMATLKITDTIFVKAKQTADFQITKGLRDILDNEGNVDDLIAFMAEKNLPVDEIELNNLAVEIQRNPPTQGYLTISNALQWRLQYTRVIEKAGMVDGVLAVYRGHKS